MITGYSGVPRRAAIILVASLLAASSAQAEKIRPIADAEFSKLLQGCWDNEEHALLDVGEFSSHLTVCFETDGHIVVDARGYGFEGEYSSKGAGTYWLASKLLHLENTGPSEGWPFGDARVQCDAVVRLYDPGLELTNCVDAEAPEQGQLGTKSANFYFRRSDV